MRLSIIVVGCIATLMALTVRSIYGLWYLSSDLVFVILFPQLVCVVYYKKSCNTYGSLAAYFIGFFLRAAGGEEIMNLAPFIHYPFYDKELGQLFPFRTFAMLTSFFTLIGVSKLTKWLFESSLVPPYFDVFHCVINIREDTIIVQEPQEEELTVLHFSIVKKYQASEINGRVNPALDSEDEEEKDEKVEENQVVKKQGLTKGVKHQTISSKLFKTQILTENSQGNFKISQL